MDESIQELMTVNTAEWNNIPQPLIRSINVMKKCILSQMQAISISSDKVGLIGKQTDVHLREFESDIRSVKKLIVTNEDFSTNSIKDLNENLKKNYDSAQKVKKKNPCVCRIEFVSMKKKT